MVTIFPSKKQRILLHNDANCCHFNTVPPPSLFLQFKVNYSKVNGAKRMPVGWVMMSKHLALPGQQLGSGDANEGTGLHLVPGNELMQLSVSTLMNIEMT